MKQPKVVRETQAVREIPSIVTKVDLQTGDEHHEQMSWKVMPPRKDTCQVCAVKHHPNEPHNQQSLYYQMIFEGQIGRAPTWADAMAHCDDTTKAEWEAALRERNAWSEPNNNEKPVRHHGM